MPILFSTDGDSPEKLNYLRGCSTENGAEIIFLSPGADQPWKRRTVSYAVTSESKLAVFADIYQDLMQKSEALVDKVTAFIDEDNLCILSISAQSKKEVFDKCDSVTVSIDSFRPDYIGRRGVSSAKVKENIINLRNNYPNLPILLEAAVSKKNIDELEEIIDFAKEIKAKVKFLLQIGEALPPVDNHDIQKIESLASANPDIVEWSKPEELLLNKEHSVLKNKLYVDIHGKVTIPYHEKDVLLGGIEEIDKITDRLIKESSQSKSTRPYDLTDLQRLRPNLQERDFSMLRESLEREIEETEKMVREKLQEMWDSLTPMLELTHDQKVISEKLWEHPDLQKRRNDQKVSEFVSSISQYVSENPNITFEDFLSHLLAILKLQE